MSLDYDFMDIENDDIYKKIRGKFFHEIVIGKLNRILEKMNIQIKFEFTVIGKVQIESISAS